MNERCPTFGGDCTRGGDGPGCSDPRCPYSCWSPAFVVHPRPPESRPAHRSESTSKRAGMSDREYRTWVKSLVTTPLRKSWGETWTRVFTAEIREAMLMAKCMSIVLTWSITKGEDQRVLYPEEIQRLIRVARDLMPEAEE